MRQVTVDEVVQAMACSQVALQAKSAVSGTLLHSGHHKLVSGESGAAACTDWGRARTWTSRRASKERVGRAETIALNKGSDAAASGNLASETVRAIEEGGWAKQLRLETYSTLDRLGRGARWTCDDTAANELQAVVRAREEWEESIREELIKMNRDRQGEVSDEVRTRFLFDSNDLFGAICRIQSPANERSVEGGQWGSIKLQLRTPSLEDLRAKLSELEPTKRQYGVDDAFGSEKRRARFAEEWHALGRRCLATGHVPVARVFATRGVPPALRPELWRILLGLNPEVSTAEVEYYATLRRECRQTRLIADGLNKIDVRRVADSDYYFPFEEALEHAVLAFSRDKWLLHNCCIRTTSDDNDAFPPSGIEPNKGFVHYAAPLTFLYHREESIYFALRAMYAKYWCRLNYISTQPETLLPLCKLFEALLIEAHPALFYHLLQLHVPPLSIALPWIQLAFVPILDVDQVLLLWDRVLGFDSLLVLPVLAVAIFVYRSERLLSATSTDDVNDMMSDCSMLAAVPLLQ